LSVSSNGVAAPSGLLTVSLDVTSPDAHAAGAHEAGAGGSEGLAGAGLPFTGRSNFHVKVAALQLSSFAKDLEQLTLQAGAGESVSVARLI